MANKTIPLMRMKSVLATDRLRTGQETTASNAALKLTIRESRTYQNTEKAGEPQPASGLGWLKRVEPNNPLPD